ncbi:MAG: hypothetical protein CML96_02345 [Rhodobiaceae bacterium]|nr:hypothetical protein [Rhodobiaceae bacterium]
MVFFIKKHHIYNKSYQFSKKIGLINNILISKLMTFYILIPLGIALLAFGGDFIVSSSTALAKKMNISPMIIGIAIIGFGTSIPEIFVATNAALSNSPDIAVGGIIGSNIANILLVLGFALFLSQKNVLPKISMGDLSVMAFSTLFLIYLMSLGFIGGIWPALMISFLLVYFFLSFRFFNVNPSLDENEEKKNYFQILGLLIFSFIALFYGSDFLIQGLVGLAKKLNIPESVLGLSLAAIGTSLPELSVTLFSIIRKKSSVALGNIIGSNIINILGALGVASLVKGSLEISDDFLLLDPYILIATACWLYIIVRYGNRNPRIFGAISLLSYSVYIYALYQ